jgi:PAS domain S-box-containing protein
LLPVTTVRRFRPLPVSAAVALLSAAATVWAHWLDSPTHVAMMPVLGVTLAALLLLEVKQWPLPLLGAVAGVVAAELAYGHDVPTLLTPAVGAVVGALVGALLLRAYAHGRFMLGRVRDLVALAVLGAAGAGVGAIAGVAVATIGTTHDDYWTLVSRATIADALGVVIVTTLLLSWAADPRLPRGARGTEALALGAAVLVLGVLALHVWSDPLAYVSVLLLVWAAVRFRVRGVSTAALAMVLIADWAIARMTGPFVVTGQSEPTTLLVFQAFAMVTVVTLLLLAAALDERDLARAQRQVANDHWRRTFDSSPVGMALTGLDGVLFDANAALCEMLRCARKQLVGTSLEQLSHRDDSGEHELDQLTVASAPRVLTSERRYVAADGSIVWAEISEAIIRGLDGKPESRLVLLHDITRRKELEEQVLHAQKMEAVGRLAGGVAHDFNNLLAVMRGHAELLDDDLKVLEQARTRLAKMQNATTKAAELTDDLLTFSRRRADEPQIMDLHEVITAAQEMLLQLVGDSVELRLQLDAESPCVRADPHRIEQAVVNMAVNARDAMPLGGCLLLRTVNLESLDGTVRAVQLDVTDTGAGMTKEVARQVFEPFFTTKPPGAGTGLGLSTAYGVVRSYGGTITVQSTPGRGTTFSIQLPLTDVTHTAGREAPEPGPDGDTILVVDDEADARAYVAEVLRESGYHVLEAADAVGTLDLIDAADDTVRLVVSDIVMPGVSGPELAEEIRQRSPETQIVFVSGHPDLDPNAPGLRGVTVLRKPLQRRALLAEVEIALDQPAPVRARNGTQRPGR